MTTLRIAAAVFVKTPGHSRLKTRLAAAIGREAAEEFHRRATRCIAEVLQAARQQLAADDIDLYPYWAVAEPAAVDDPLWRDFDRLTQGTGGLGERLAHVDGLLMQDHDARLLLGADSPQTTVEDITAAARTVAEGCRSDRPVFALSPADDGGFSIFAGNRPLAAAVWQSVPYSVADTADRLRKHLDERGDFVELAPLDDVDTAGDLQRILPQLTRSDSLASQRELADWLHALLPTRD